MPYGMGFIFSLQILVQGHMTRFDPDSSSSEACSVDSRGILERGVGETQVCTDGGKSWGLLLFWSVKSDSVPVPHVRQLDTHILQMWLCIA